MMTAFVNKLICENKVCYSTVIPLVGPQRSHNPRLKSQPSLKDSIRRTRQEWRMAKHRWKRDRLPMALEFFNWNPSNAAICCNDSEASCKSRVHAHAFYFTNKVENIRVNINIAGIKALGHEVSLLSFHQSGEMLSLFNEWTSVLVL